MTPCWLCIRWANQYVWIHEDLQTRWKECTNEREEKQIHRNNSLIVFQLKENCRCKELEWNGCGFHLCWRHSIFERTDSLEVVHVDIRNFKRNYSFPCRLSEKFRYLQHRSVYLKSLQAYSPLNYEQFLHRLPSFWTTSFLVSNIKGIFCEIIISIAWCFEWNC